MNSVFLSGNLVRDPELKTTQSGTDVCDFSIAVNEVYKETKKTHFVECTAFGQPARYMTSYARKGDKVLVHGKLYQQTWDDKATGNKKSKLTVTVIQVELSSKKKDDVPQDVQQEFNPDNECPF